MSRKNFTEYDFRQNQPYPMMPEMGAPFAQQPMGMPMMPAPGMPMMPTPGMPMMPTPGMPMMPMPSTPMIPGVPMAPGADDFQMAPGSPVIQGTEYTQGYLRTQIGSKVKIEFLIGTNMLIDREGTLMEVGISFVIIQEVETDDLLLCDIYSIKFVRFYG